MTTTLRPQGPPEPGADRPAGRDDGPARTRSQLFAVCSNGRPIGSVRLSKRDRQGWIADLEVAPERRRRGHGSVAVLAAEEVLRSWGCRHVEVNVPAASVPAVALFEAMGYTLDRQRMLKRLSRLSRLGGLGRPARPGRGLGRAAAGAPAGSVVRPLREREYPEWLAEEIAGFADDMAARVAGGREEAQTRAREAYAALLPDGLGTRGVAVRALEVAGERVGTVLVAFTARDLPDCGWVHHVLVDPAHRGHGYGRVLIRAAERECRVAGIRLLGLNVYADNTVAQALYASLGYRTDLWVLTKPL